MITRVHSILPQVLETYLRKTFTVVRESEHTRDGFALVEGQTRRESLFSSPVKRWANDKQVVLVRGSEGLV
jgi:hypothetical protein